MRTCSVDNCFQPVFGTDKNTGDGYCSRHQWKRTDKEKKPLQMHSNKPKMHEITFGYDNQTDMFHDLWSKAKDKECRIICPYTGENLYRFRNTSLYWSCFMHLLPKKNYPYFKLNPDNIRIVHPNFHRIMDQGSLADRERHPEWKFEQCTADVFEMKEKYLQFKRDNQLS